MWGEKDLTHTYMYVLRKSVLVLGIDELEPVLRLTSRWGRAVEPSIKDSKQVYHSHSSHTCAVVVMISNATTRTVTS